MLSSDDDIRTNEAKRFRDDTLAAGKILLKDEAFAAVQSMVESVRRVCGKWLDLPGRKEQSIYWENELTGLPMKMRLDWLVIGQRPVVFDLKTTTDASPLAFRTTIERQRYWLQHPQYVEGIEAVTGETPLFYFIAVENKFPFACAIHEIDPDSAELANMRRNELLSQLADCFASGEWSEPWEQRINALPLRQYCFASTIQPEPV